MIESSLLLIAMDALALFVGLAGGDYLSSYISNNRHLDAQTVAQRMVVEARKEA